jgi:hypothetical protein
MVCRIPDAIMFFYYLILYVKPCSQTKIRVKPGHLHCTTNKKKMLEIFDKSRPKWMKLDLN